MQDIGDEPEVGLVIASRAEWAGGTATMARELAEAALEGVRLVGNDEWTGPALAAPGLVGVLAGDPQRAVEAFDAIADSGEAAMPLRPGGDPVARGLRRGAGRRRPAGRRGRADRGHPRAGRHPRPRGRPGRAGAVRGAADRQAGRPGGGARPAGEDDRDARATTSTRWTSPAASSPAAGSPGRPAAVRSRGRRSWTRSSSSSRTAHPPGARWPRPSSRGSTYRAVAGSRPS